MTLNFFVLSASSRVSLGDVRKKPPLNDDILNDDIRECGEWEMRKVSPFPRSEGALRRESGRAIRRLSGFLRPTTEGTRNADSRDVTEEDWHTDCVFCWYCSENDLPPSPLFEGRPIGACCSCFSTDIAQPEDTASFPLRAKTDRQTDRESNT